MKDIALTVAVLFAACIPNHATIQNEPTVKRPSKPRRPNHEAVTYQPPKRTPTTPRRAREPIIDPLLAINEQLQRLTTTLDRISQKLAEQHPEDRKQPPRPAAKLEPVKIHRVDETCAVPFVQPSVRLVRAPVRQSVPSFVRSFAPARRRPVRRIVGRLAGILRAPVCR